MMASFDAASFSLLASLAFCGSIFVFIALLPALLEIKKPRDAGPRVVTEKANISETNQVPSLEENENVCANQNVMRRLRDIISILPDLEE